ncbi:PucR family transcriptional regulator [Paenibacillus gansuensis]|uniref:PucR family transcriptional regulator n=1 Tax=Paenibacillus gansuensis TaxID=306542 RepID=A0ABW5PFP5_9BACL
MDWERIRKKLELILTAPVTLTFIHEAQIPEERGSSFVQDHQVLFPLYTLEDGRVAAFEVDEGLISQSERSLMELSILAYREQVTIADPHNDEEFAAQQLGQWIVESLHKNIVHTDLPDALAAMNKLYVSKIPLLLYADDSEPGHNSYAELKRLLEAFFDEDIILVPLLEKEWLILASESLVQNAAEDSKDDGPEETQEESLTSLCSGLYEMIASEWVPECHLSVHFPMVPAKSLLAAVTELRETVALGRKFNVGSNIHVSWVLRLERLLSGITEGNKQQFMEQVLKGFDYVIDSETLATLETFFMLDCNVSETAKKLYIHRNTLLYRLDKFKQETGLDVRNFSHAVLVKISLLLYKVTKRK